MHFHISANIFPDNDEGRRKALPEEDGFLDKEMDSIGGGCASIIDRAL